MINTDKENEHKNAILIRFKDTKSAKNYFIRYNGQIHNTDMISLCNFDDPHSLKAELEKANAEIATLKDRLAYEVDMIDGACNEQVQKLMGDLKLAMETIETLNKLKDNVQKERRQIWIELEKARELIEAQSKFLNRFKDGFYLNNSFSELVSLYKDLTDFEIGKVDEFLKTKEGTNE